MMMHGLTNFKKRIIVFKIPRSSRTFSLVESLQKSSPIHRVPALLPLEIKQS
jgi:hypothetical protein